MRPIPKSMLPHSVTLHKPQKGQNFWDETTIGNGEKLSYVKMEPSSKIVRDKNNAEIQLAATLFYDCKNSKPRNVAFCVNDTIVFNGQKHQVRVIEPLYDKRKLHHYELGLVKYA